MDNHLLLFPAVKQPQSCLQSCGAVSTFFFFLQCSSHSPACRVVEQSPPSFSCNAAATVLPAKVWSRLHLLLHGHAAIQRSRCGPAAIERLQPPSETSPALTLWADGLNIPMAPSCCPRRHPAVLPRTPAIQWSCRGPAAAFMRPSLPSCGPHRLHAALAAFMRPPLPSCGPRRLHAAVASFVRPSPPSCGRRRLHAALAAFLRPSPPSCGRRRLPAALAAFVRPSPPSYGRRRFRAAVTALVQPAQPPARSRPSAG